MSKQVYENAKVWLGKYDLTGDMNAIALDYGSELADGTTGGDGTRGNLAGLKTVSANFQGLFEAGADLVDDALFSKMGVADEIMSVCPIAGVDGEVAYMFKATEGEYSPAAAIGEAFAFSVVAEASGSPLVRGAVMHNATRTSSQNGTARQLGALSATQTLYAALHVFSGSGTLDLTIESADNEAMASATTQLTFAQATGKTSEWLELDGAVTDDWWRGVLTIGGGSPSFEAALILGII